MAVVAHTYVNKKNRTRRIWLAISLVIIVIVCGAGWYWNSNKEEIVGNKIQKAVSEKSGGLYSANYDSIQLNELAGRLEISGLHIGLDSSLQGSLQTKKQLPAFLTEMSVPIIRISGLKTPKAVFNKKIIGRKLEIINPSLTIYQTGRSNKKEYERELYKTILGDLELLQVDTLMITGANIISKEKGKNEFDIRNFSASFYGVKIDSASGEDKSRILFSSRFVARADRFSWSKTGSLYDNLVENISVQSETGNIRIGKMQMRPTLGEDAFVNAKGIQDDRYDWSMSGINIARMDIRNLLEEKFFAGDVKVNHTTLKIYRDKAKPRDAKIRSEGPAKSIRQIPIPLDIGKITFANGYVEYKEKNKTTREKGKVPFHQVHAVITNFSNQHKHGDNKMKIAINSRLLNTTPVSLNFSFNLFDELSRFTVSGRTGAMNATLLNPLTEPMAQAKIRQGNLKKLHFDFAGSENDVNGMVELLYDDLKVDVLELDRGAKKQDKKFLTSLFANIMISNANPKGDDAPRVAQKTYIRDQHYSVLNATFVTLFAGIQDILGVRKRRR